MSQRPPIPVWLAELRRTGSPGVTVPLTLPAPFGVARGPGPVGDELVRALDAGFMETGVYDTLLPAIHHGPPEVCEIAVTMPAIDALRPSLSLRLPAVVMAATTGFSVVFPGLDLEAWGLDRDAALAAAGDSVLAELSRSDRRGDPRRLVEIQWFDGLALHRIDPELPWYTFNERRELAADRERRSGALLAACGDPIAPTDAFGLDAARADLRRAVLARTTAGVVLVGPRGSGKSALIASEAHAADAAFRGIRPVRAEAVWSTTAARLEHALVRGAPWQANLTRLVAELHRDRLWLHVASLADLFEVGRYVGNDQSIGDYLRPSLGRGELAIVTECTAEEYARLEVRYPGWLEQLTRVDVPGPDDARLASIVDQWIRARRGSAVIELAAGDEAIRLLRRFAPYAGYPGRVLGLLGSLGEAGLGRVERADVIARFCDESGVPRAFVDPDIRLGHAELAARFDGALFGQPDAVRALADVATSVKADVTPRGRPIASMLMLGPTGVGKTEAARALAAVIFGSKDRMVRFDMSEFSTPAAVASMSSSPDPHGEGRLTGAVRRQPFSVLLLDEIEKAHPDMFDLLLQVLGEGRLTDHRGRVADFCSAIVVMTSNIGAERLGRARVGLGRDAERSASGVATELWDAVRDAFRPELVNRIDRIIPFGPLDRDVVARVLDRELTDLARNPALTDADATVEVSEAVRAHLCARGYEPARGARPLQRVVRDELVTAIAVALNAAPPHWRHRLSADLVDGVVEVRIASEPTPQRVARREGPGAFRRSVHAVLEGLAATEHATAILLAERRARAAASLGRFEGTDAARLHQLREPLDVLRDSERELIALEAQAYALEPVEPALSAVDARVLRAEQALFASTHPAAGAAFAGVYCPGEGADPADAAPAQVVAWVTAAVDAAEAVGLTAIVEHVWLANDAPVAVAWTPAPQLPRPPARATKWLGIELWVHGAGAACLVVGRGGLFVLPRASGEAERRVRIVVGSTRGSEIPPCCRRGYLGDAAVHKVRGRLVPPRPEGLPRRATYEGKAESLPPGPSVRAFRDALAEHLSRTEDAP